MFFEDKFAELREEYGFEKFIEVNQNAGDIIVIPEGYSTVVLSIIDSISYRESVDKAVKPLLTSALWNPPFQYTYVFCLSGQKLEKAVGNPQGAQQVQAAQQKPEQVASNWL